MSIEQSLKQNLPLSHMLYNDNEVDSTKASKLVVMHYHLQKGQYKWREWDERLDNTLSALKINCSADDLTGKTIAHKGKYFPYFMRSHNGQFGLFVALDNEKDVPPTILDANNKPIKPVRIDYDQSLNPVWIRLLMRKVTAFGMHCRGTSSCGRPLLQVERFTMKDIEGEAFGGINAISLDCRTQQRQQVNEKGSPITEVVIFHSNVPLRELNQKTLWHEVKKPLWVYEKDRVLVRWYPKKDEKPNRPVYQVVSKNRNSRKQHSFINLKNLERLEGSWPFLLQPIQDSMIELCAQYGFELKPLELSLLPLKSNTKYRNNSSKKSSFADLPLGGAIKVLDLRENKTLSTNEIVFYLNGLLAFEQRNDPNIQPLSLEALPRINISELDNLILPIHQKILIILDQRKGVKGDNYLHTRALNASGIVQHLNVNPHDLGYLNTLKKSKDKENCLPNEADLFFSKNEENDETLFPKKEYYAYDMQKLEYEDVKKNLAFNLAICLKELHLKHLLRDPQAKVSESLPKQAKFLTEELVVITNGYLFTVIEDRPILLPFDPTNPHKRNACNQVLKNFGSSCENLFHLMMKSWPYSYKPEHVMDSFGNANEKLQRFAHRLTLVVHKKDIFMQDPGYETPHILLNNHSEIRELVKGQGIKISLQKWLLPEKMILQKAIQECLKIKKSALDESRFDPSSDEYKKLKKEQEKYEKKIDKLNENLDKYIEYWNQAIVAAYKDGKISLTRDEMNKYRNKVYQEALREEKGLPENAKVRGDNTLTGLWFEIITDVLDLPMEDKRKWLKQQPGLKGLWHDPDAGYYLVGQLSPFKDEIIRQPSIRHWHALQGKLDTEFLTKLLDVDWVRMNQLAGNPCVSALIKKWIEMNNNELIPLIFEPVAQSVG